MDAVTYPQDQIVAFIHDYFVPVRIHTDAHPELCAKYHVAWTPTFLVLDPDGTEHYRDIGYLPPADFVAHLTLALGHTALEQKDYATAAKFFQTAMGRARLSRRPFTVWVSRKIVSAAGRRTNARPYGDV